MAAKDDHRRLLICFGSALGTLFLIAFCYAGVGVKPSSNPEESLMKKEQAFLESYETMVNNGIQDELREDELKENQTDSIKAIILDLDHQITLQNKITEDELDLLENSVTSLENGQTQLQENITSISKNVNQLQNKMHLQIRSVSGNCSSQVDMAVSKMIQQQDEVLLKMEKKYANLQAEIEVLKNETMNKKVLRGCSSSSFFVKRKSAMTNLVVMGAHADGSPYYGCRAKVFGNNVIPGTYNIKQEACYIAINGGETTARENDEEIEVFTNPQNSNLIWKSIDTADYHDQWFKQEGVVMGGKTRYGALVFIVRCRHRHGKNNFSWIPGWLQLGSMPPIYSYAGQQHFCQPGSVEALVCKAEVN